MFSPFIVCLLSESMSCWFRSSIGSSQIRRTLSSLDLSIQREIMSLFSRDHKEQLFIRMFTVFRSCCWEVSKTGEENPWCSLASQPYSWTRSSVIPRDPYLIIRLLKGLWILHRRHFCQPDHHGINKAASCLFDQQKMNRKPWKKFCPSDHITVKVRISTSRTLTLAKIASDRSDPPARGPSPPRQFSTREVWLGLVLFSKATRSCWELCSYGIYLKQKSWMLTSYQLYINSNILLLMSVHKVQVFFLEAWFRRNFSYSWTIHVSHANSVAYFSCWAFAIGEDFHGATGTFWKGGLPVGPAG